MIFVFSDDQSLTVLENIEQVRVECEGIDVENDLYHFFDEKGLLLKPNFTHQNKKGKNIGIIGWSESGVFELVPTKNQDLSLILNLLENSIFLEENVFFKSLQEIKNLLTKV